MMTDPIADLLTRVRNGLQAKHKKVDLPASQLKVAIVELWQKAGYISGYRLYRRDSKPVLRIHLKYFGKEEAAIHGVWRVSHSRGRVYLGWKKLPQIVNGLGMAIVSTSKGVMSDETARSLKIGGEVLCAIW